MPSAARVEPEPQASGASHGRPLRARGQRTLQRLLEAGAEVFAERGYHAARVDDIVHAASTSHGTFYLYFSSKQDLFRALATEAAGEMVELAQALPPLTADRAGYDALHEWLGQFADLYARCGAVIRTWTDAEIVDSDIGRIGGDLVSQFSKELARRLLAAAPDLDVRVTSTALVSMIERSNYYLQSDEVKVPPADMITTLAAVTHASLFGAEARRR
jgi:AcrR family transcriptional regulator